MVRFVSPLPLIVAVSALVAQSVEADQVQGEPLYARLANVSVQSQLRGTKKGAKADGLSVPSICSTHDKYKQCNSDIAEKLAQGEIDPTKDPATFALNWFQMGADVSGSVNECIEFLMLARSMDPEAVSNFGLAAFGVVMTIASGTLANLGAAVGTQCDAECMFAQTATFTKEFVEKEIEEKFYKSLVDKISGANHRMGEIAKRVEDFSPVKCTFTEVQGKAPVHDLKPYKSLYRLGLNSAKALCLVVGKDVCKNIMCEATPENITWCAVYNHSTLHDGFSNQTSHQPSTDCFDQKNFDLGDAPAKTVEDVLGKIGALLSEMNMQLFSEFTGGLEQDVTGIPMPNTTMYAAMYATSYFGAYARAIQTKGTEWHLSGERDLFVNEIDELTTWVNDSLTKAYTDRLAYIGKERKQDTDNVIFYTHDNFRQKCWETNSAYSARMCVPVGTGGGERCYWNVINENAEKDVDQCYNLHKDWVKTQLDAYFDLTRNLVKGWQKLKKLANEWKLPSGASTKPKAKQKLLAHADGFI